MKNPRRCLIGQRGISWGEIRKYIRSKSSIYDNTMSKQYKISDKRLRTFLLRRLGGALEEVERYMEQNLAGRTLPFEKWKVIFIQVLMDELQWELFNGREEDEVKKIYQFLRDSFMVVLDPMIRRIYYSDNNS